MADGSSKFDEHEPRVELAAPERSIADDLRAVAERLNRRACETKLPEHSELAEDAEALWLAERGYPGFRVPLPPSTPKKQAELIRQFVAAISLFMARRPLGTTDEGVARDFAELLKDSAHFVASRFLEMADHFHVAQESSAPLGERRLALAAELRRNFGLTASDDRKPRTAQQTAVETLRVSGWGDDPAKDAVYAACQKFDTGRLRKQLVSLFGQNQEAITNALKQTLNPPQKRTRRSKK